MTSIIRLQRAFSQNLRGFVNIRTISTSKKNNETVDIAEINKCEPKVKNWVSYGFDQKSETSDRISLSAVFLSSITLCLVFGGYLLVYMPDYNLRDWAQREAYLELRRREEKGLPLVDPNLVDPKKIKLPSDDELGDTEIII